jgi:hypothetical protein
MGSQVLHGEVGDRCPRCGQWTQVRAHKEITDKQLSQPFYYSRWFVCVNRRCRTTLIMPERFKMFNELPRHREPTVRLSIQYRDDSFRGLDPCDPHSQHAGVNVSVPPWDYLPRAASSCSSVSVVTIGCIVFIRI